MKKSLPWFITGHFGHHLLGALPQPLLPSIRDTFGLSIFQTELVSTVFSFASGLGNIPAGRLSDKLGPTWLMTIATLGVAISGFLVGLSGNFLWFMIFLTLMALMTAGYHPASTPMILSAVEPEKRGRALGLHLLGGNASFFISPIIAGFIVKYWPSMGARGPFLVMSIPAIIIGVLFFIYLYRRGGVAQVKIAKQRAAQENPPQAGYKRRLWAYLIQMIIGGGAAVSINALLGLYMVDRFGVDKASVPWILSVNFLPAVFGGTIMGGWISDRIGSVKIIITTGIIGGLLNFGIAKSTG